MASRRVGRGIQEARVGWGSSPEHGSGGARKEAEVSGVVRRPVDDSERWEHLQVRHAAVRDSFSSSQPASCFPVQWGYDTVLLIDSLSPGAVWKVLT